MNDTLHINDFNLTLNTWINQLERYTFVQLCRKPSSHSWSVGQLYMHLIEATRYFIEQITICLSHTANITKETSSVALILFANNCLPDKLFEGPPSNGHICQPLSKEYIKTGLQNLQHQINSLVPFNEDASNRGKTEHLGLGYFTASQWLQFADIHLRHHFRQKERIDAFFKSNS